MKVKHAALIVFVLTISIGLTLLYKTFGSLSEDQSLLGADSNHNGIRDDIEKYIQDRFPNSEKRRAALLQLARAWQSVFSVYDQPEQMKTEYLKVVNGNYCVLGVFDKEGGTVVVHSWLNFLAIKNAAKLSSIQRLKQQCE